MEEPIEPTAKPKYMKLSHNHLKGIKNRVIPSWIEQIEQDFDRVVLVVGVEGVGKSTLALLLGHMITNYRNEKFGIDRPFKLEDNLYYDLRKLKREVFKDSEPGDVRIIDEAAITGGYRREAMGKQNRLLNKTLMTCRSRNQILMFLIPSLNAVESYILERASCVIRVVQRGHCWVYHTREKRRFIIWDSKKRRTIFKQRPFLHKERYSSVQYHISEEEWERYNKHKEDSLSAEYDEDEEDAQPEKENIPTKYIGRGKILKMFDISDFTWNRYRAENPKAIKKTIAGWYKVDPEHFRRWYFNEEEGANNE